VEMTVDRLPTVAVLSFFPPEQAGTGVN